MWDLRAKGGPCLLRTTFTEDDGEANVVRAQAFPDEYPGASHPAGTGAVERSTLGFTFDGKTADSVYRLSFSFPHRDPTLTLRFSAEGIEGTSDESWGLDDVKVEAIPAIEPAGDSDLVAALEDLGGEDVGRMPGGRPEDVRICPPTPRPTPIPVGGVDAGRACLDSERGNETKRVRLCH